MATKTKRTREPVLSTGDNGSLATRAYQQIRDGILQGRLAIGDILSRRRLADELNMSFLPITEALQLLESEGLVESRPRSGTRVRIPTEQDVQDSYVIREALETQAARLCCERMTQEERELIKRSAEHLDSLYKTAEAETDDSRFLFSVHTYHMQFHLRVAEFSRSSGLVKAIEKQQVLIFNWLYDTASHRKSLPARFHSDLAAALCSGSVLQAQEAMRAHILYGLDEVIESLKKVEVSKGWRHKRGT